MSLVSKNPATEEIIKEHREFTDEELNQKLQVAHDTFLNWRETFFAHRAERMKRLAQLLRENARHYGELMALEMGKPIKQGIAEAEKCAWVCEFYAAEAEKFLAPEYVKTDAGESFVRFEPIGAVLAVMPWNFPFWQVFRFIAPAAMAGNVGVLKHASNVQGCAQAIEELFDKAGFPQGVFQNLAIGSDKVAGVIADPRIEAVTLTGSEGAGRKVAEAAGREIKKTVLELGGSDPFIILADANLDQACTVATTARLQNNGQSCIAAKRFIAVESVAGEFLQRFKERFEAMVVGDPLDEKTDVGPLVSERALQDIEDQIKRTLEAGAKLVIGGKRKEEMRKGYFYTPTILSEVKKGMPAYSEEIFGPVASVITVADVDEAVAVANDTRFGLGASLWTQDLALAKKLAAQIDAGAVFINGMVKSDPRLPFGGVKRSGYGRELGEYGIKEFTNIKTVWIK